MNHCIFIGNLADNPKLETIDGKNGEVSVLKFRIGVNDRQRKKVTFPSLEAWGKGAEMIAQYFTKGDLIRVFCRLETDTWDDKKTGEKRYRDKFVVEQFQFVEARSKKPADDAEGEESEATEEKEQEEESEPEPEKARGRGKSGGKSAGKREPATAGAGGGSIPF